MFPSFSSCYTANRTLGNSKHFCDFILEKTLFIKTSYFTNLFNIKFSLRCKNAMISLKSHSISMSNVLFRGTPFEILNSIIRFISIYMVNLMSCAGIGNEALCYKSMNKNKFSKILISKRHFSIFSYFSSVQYFSRVGSVMRSIFHRSATSPLITYFIKAFVPNNIFPNFFCHKLMISP